ncbi:MAG TPA: hypothetical protein VFH82_01145 [Gemmatimonadota bacterium]|jgi:hypothetical protein|nr:hypothetical protein [Gemmatimonadota bacterium]
MTSERTREGHPSDLELVAWIDDPGIGPDLSAHLATCDGCRDRVARLTAIRGAIALDPPMPSGAEFAAQRERILEAIERASREGGGRTVRRIGWLLPLAAAAAVAAIVLVNRADPPETAPAREEVVAEADAAAEEAAAIATDEQALDAALAAIEALNPPASIERSAAVEDEFALLSEAEQSAVLRELEGTDFDL